jgi:hypothetical protein
MEFGMGMSTLFVLIEGTDLEGHGGKGRPPAGGPDELEELHASRSR